MYVISSQTPVSYVVMSANNPYPTDSKCKCRSCKEEDQTRREAANVIFALTDALKQLGNKVQVLQDENAELREQLDKRNKIDRMA